MPTDSAIASTPAASTPGELFDLQVNGFAGVDFQGPVSREDLRRACERLRECGMRRILATFITCTPDALRDKLRRFTAILDQDEYVRETIVGYHLEGPWLSAEPGYRGAHPADLMTDPDWAEFQRYQDAAGGGIRLVTLAPERDGAAEFIASAVQSGVRISLGHTNADEAQIDRAIEAGATLCTHLGNGCPELLPRHHSIIHRLLARDELIACFIPDGIHLPPGVLRNLYRAKPPGKVILTTDAMAAAGAGPGRYRLGHLEMEVGADEIVRMPGSPYLAGSALRLDRGVERAAQWLGVDLDAARAMAGSVPAQALGFSF